MKYKLINPKIESHFAENLLRFRGVNDIYEFTHPGPQHLSDPLNLTNLTIGADLLLQHLKANSNIWFVVDCDVDGYTSAAILWNYIKNIYPSAQLHYLIHEAKQHGLADNVQWILDHSDEIDLMIIPDAGSNDDQSFQKLVAVNIPCLVLDHHEIEGEISQKAVIINNQSSQQYKNKDLTGAGVVYQFCRYIDTVLNVNYADNYIDLAALGIISDMGSMLSLENRYIINTGLMMQNKNLFFKEFIERQAYSIGATLTPIGIAFYVTPLINAMIRVGTMEEKKKLFTAFIDPDRIVDSTKRGEKGMDERLATQMVRECINARARQNKIKEAVVERLEQKIEKNNLLDNKILLVRLEQDDDFPPVLNGLVAMQLAAKYKRPTIVARLDDEGHVRGSARGLNESELKDFKGYLQSTGEFNYTAGHANAFGVSIDNTKLTKLHTKANQELGSINFTEDSYDVNFEFEAREGGSIMQCIFEMSPLKDSFGQMNPEPLYAITDLVIYPAKDLMTMGANKDTIKIVKNGVAYMKFKDAAFIEQLSQYECVKLDLVGRGNINEWGGTQTAQIFIDDYNIEDYSTGF